MARQEARPPNFFTASPSGESFSSFVVPIFMLCGVGPAMDGSCDILTVIGQPLSTPIAGAAWDLRVRDEYSNRPGCRGSFDKTVD